MKKLLLIIIILISKEALSQSKQFTLEQFGAKADGVVLSDGAIQAGSNLLNSNSAAFKPTDVGKIIFISGADKDGNTLIGIISSVASSKSVTVSTPAILSVINTGITYGTDCTDAFIQFNAKARFEQNAILNMKPGTYLTKFNNYLAGIKNVVLNGNGCNLICTHGAYEPLNSPRANVGLFMPSCFDNVDNNYYENKQLGNTSIGYKIQTAIKGATAVQAINTSDAANFKIGNWVLIYGLHHEDFGGWPPDPRYFEYAKIKNLDTDKGIIYLDRPLINFYDAGWPDGKSKDGAGAPRIINLDRDNFTIVENLAINNMNFLPFNCWNGKYADFQRNSRLELYGFIEGKISNVTAAGAYFGQGEKLIVDHITLTGGCEPDKVLDSCIIKNSIISIFVGAGGLNYLELVNNTFYRGFNASPRNLYVEGNTFKTVGSTSKSLAAFGFNKGTDYINIGSNTWDCSDATRNALISPPSAVVMKVDEIVNDNTIGVSYDSYVKSHNSRRVEPGAIGYTASGKQIIVTRVYQNNENNIAISGKYYNGNPEVGDAYSFSMAPKIYITGKQIKLGDDSGKYSLFQNVPPNVNIIYSESNFKN